MKGLMLQSKDTARMTVRIRGGFILTVTLCGNIFCNIGLCNRSQTAGDDSSSSLKASYGRTIKHNPWQPIFDL